LINKTFAQLNAERALRRARPIKKNKKKNKAASSQAGGPAPKESGLKQQAIQETVPYNDIEEAQS
jgi:hypothetical protein